MFVPTLNKLKYMLAIIFLLALNPVYAQTPFCPPNIDFETGTLANWEFFNGSCCPIGNLASTPAMGNRHRIITGNAVDPFGLFPVVAPGSGSFSLMLGNSQGGKESERARYHVQVPNVPGRQILLYRYAVVLQDPGHDPADQPLFVVSAYDSITNAPLQCSQFSYVSSSILPGFTKSPMASNVFYRPWSTGSIDLTQYRGRTVSIDFTTGDCALGGHFAYAYIDMNCGLYQLEPVNCNSNIQNVTISGPHGYQGYQWYTGNFSANLGSGQVLNLATPPSGSTFAVVLTPYPGFGCIDTLYTTYNTARPSSVTISAQKDTTLCAGGTGILRTRASGTDGPFSFLWTPATGLSCSTCANPRVNADSTTYTVIATNLRGCSDTAYIDIKKDSVVKAALAAPTDTICVGETITINNSITNNPAGTINTWEVLNPNGTIIAGGTGHNYLTYQPSIIGSHSIIVTTNLGDCIDMDTIRIVSSPGSNIMPPAPDTLCQGEEKMLEIKHSNNSPLTYKWDPPTFLSCSNCPNPVASPNAPITYRVSISNAFGCKDTVDVILLQDTAINSVIVKNKDSVCTNELVRLWNTGKNPRLISNLWDLDKGVAVYGAQADTIGAYWQTSGVKKVIHTVLRDICNTKDTIEVYVLPSAVAHVEVPSYGCIGTKMTMYPGQGADKYSWTIDDHNFPQSVYNEKYDLQWNTTGKKKIRLVTHDYHCTDTFEKEIGIYDYPGAKISISQDNDFLCEGYEFTLNANEGSRYIYTWQPALAFSNNSSAEVKGIAEKTKYYYLQVTNEWGCSSYDSALVHVKSCCEIFLPDAFTPNGDGRNDRFWSPELNYHQIKRFVVANRRGQVVYESVNSPGNGWDGTYKGEPLGQDTYNYYLIYNCFLNGAETMKKGSIILLK